MFDASYYTPKYPAPSCRKKKPAKPVTAAIDYDNMDFYGVSSTARRSEGIVTSDTIHHYHCNGHTIWGEYSGGGVVGGSFIGDYYPEDGSASFQWWHTPIGSKPLDGSCEITPEVLPDGRVRLTKKWRYSKDDKNYYEGINIVESFPDEGKLYTPAVDTPVQTAAGGQSVSSV